MPAPAEQVTLIKLIKQGSEGAQHVDSLFVAYVRPEDDVAYLFEYFRVDDGGDGCEFVRFCGVALGNEEQGALVVKDVACREVAHHGGAGADGVAVERCSQGDTALDGAKQGGYIRIIIVPDACQEGVLACQFGSAARLMTAMTETRKGWRWRSRGRVSLVQRCRKVEGV